MFGNQIRNKENHENRLKEAVHPPKNQLVRLISHCLRSLMIKSVDKTYLIHWKYFGKYLSQVVQEWEKHTGAMRKLAFMFSEI